MYGGRGVRRYDKAVTGGETEKLRREPSPEAGMAAVASFPRPALSGEESSPWTLGVRGGYARRRRLKAASAWVLTLTLTLAALYAAPHFDRSGAKAMAALGLVVREVEVSGRRQTPADVFADALGVAVGSPLFAFSPHAARARLRALGWVEEALVRRSLNGVVRVTLRERRPFALWRRGAHVFLLDGQGAVMESWPSLSKKALAAEEAAYLTLSGEGAGEGLSALWTTLSAHELRGRRVVGLHRQGGRRWDVHLEGGIVVHLPAANEAAAWRRLARANRVHGVLDGAVASVDLRNEGRMVLTPRMMREVAP